MASATNVTFLDDCIMDDAFLISLAHAFFSATLLLPISGSFIFYSVDFFSGLHSHLHRQDITKSYLIKSLCIGFSEFHEP